jgi:excisionase family DNA binding protein
MALRGDRVTTRGTPAGTQLALSVEDAAASLSLSRDSFERYVMPELRLVRVGRRLLVPRRELERWIDRSSAIALVAELSQLRSAPKFTEGTNGQ